MISGHELFGRWAAETMSAAEMRAWLAFEELGERPPSIEDAEKAEREAWAAFQAAAEVLLTASPLPPEARGKAKAAYDRWAQCAALLAVAERWRGKVEDQLSERNNTL